MDVDCRLNDPDVPVQLLKLQKVNATDGKKITKSGQIFTIHHFSLSDGGAYYCAVSTGKPSDRKIEIHKDPRRWLTCSLKIMFEHLKLHFPFILAIW